MRHARHETRSIERDAEKINAPGQFLQLRVGLEVRLRGGEQASLLSRCDRLLRLHQSTTPDLDLDHDEFVTPAHDQIKFADGASPLLGQAGVACRFELPTCELFSRVAKGLSRRPHYGARSHEATGEKHRR